MNYEIERDWNSNAGYRAIVLMTRRRHRCGYVGIPSDHPLFGKDYSEKVDSLPDLPPETPFGNRGVMAALFGAHDGQKRLDVYFDVHGSLTFSRHGKDGYPVASDLWWFGFDCSHAGDDDEGGKPLEFVEQQCEQLAEQLARLAMVTQQ